MIGTGAKKRSYNGTLGLILNSEKFLFAIRPIIVLKIHVSPSQWFPETYTIFSVLFYWMSSIRVKKIQENDEEKSYSEF